MFFYGIELSCLEIDEGCTAKKMLASNVEVHEVTIHFFHLGCNNFLGIHLVTGDIVMELHEQGIGHG